MVLGYFCDLVNPSTSDAWGFHPLVYIFCNLQNQYILNYPHFKELTNYLIIDDSTYLVPSNSTIFSLKSRPMVASVDWGNLPAQNLKDRQVFPKQVWYELNIRLENIYLYTLHKWV